MTLPPSRGGIPWTSNSAPYIYRICPPYVDSQDWCRTLAELSLTLAGFRLFLAAGLLKMRVGSACWKDLTCLYDHYETQPMPNTLSWMFHNYTPHAMLSVMQWFAINLAECIVPYFLLSFFLSMGPLGVVHRQLLRRKEWFLRFLALIPGRLIGCVLIMIFVFGMFVGGNYAFLHPLAIVSLVASCGTVQGIPVTRKPESRPTILYRTLMPWVVLPLLIFAFLPSLRAYAARLIFLICSRVIQWVQVYKTDSKKIRFRWKLASWHLGGFHRCKRFAAPRPGSGLDVKELASWNPLCNLDSFSKRRRWTLESLTIIMHILLVQFISATRSMVAFPCEVWV